MKSTRLWSMLVVAGLTGCLSTPKTTESKKLPEADSATPAVKQASAINPTLPAPTDPLPSGLTPKFTDFMTNQGLAGPPTKPTEAVRMTVAWNNKIIFAPDPTRGGDPVPGLLARVYLFSQSDQTLMIDGEFLAGVWDLTPKAEGGRPQLMELWHIDPTSAKKFQRPDFMGSGYTIFFPWSKYNVDLKQVTAQIRFNGADGRSLVATPEVLTVDHSETLARAAEKLSGRSVSNEAGGKAAAVEPIKR